MKIISHKAPEVKAKSDRKSPLPDARLCQYRDQSSLSSGFSVTPVSGRAILERVSTD